MKSNTHITWFRNAAPYIDAHRRKTFVICFGGEVAQRNQRLIALVHDIALLSTLDVRLVLVHGARPQIETRLVQKGCDWRYVDGLRLTDGTALQAVIEAAAAVRVQIEALLSMGISNTPMSGVHLSVVGGNAVIAKPLGIRDGVDFQHTGEVRRIDVHTLRAQLEQGQIVLLSPLGYSPTGEVFNLSATEIATTTAIALHADKLVFFEEGPLCDEAGVPLRQLGLAEAQRLAHETSSIDEPHREHLRAALDACLSDVRRVHLIDLYRPDALLTELFTRDGGGVLISADGYESLRQATITDIGGIIEVIEPLEHEGILVRRSREQLELEIDHFSVLKRDGTIIACAALYPYPTERMAELACLAVTSDYRHQGFGDVLLRSIEARACEQGLKQLFVLTTRTAHWFLERGFIIGNLDDLPMTKRQPYNYRRNSCIFFKQLN